METILKMSDIFMFQLPRRVVFGNGSIHQIGGEIKNLNVQRLIIVTDPGVVKAGLLTDAVSSLKKGGIQFDIFDQVKPDPPISVVEECTRKVKKEHFDAVLGVGGGSVIDAAKAISFMATQDGDIHQYLGINKVPKPGITKIFVPTTAGTGSEISNAFILTDEGSGVKISSSTPYAFADLSVIDPVLTLNLPQKTTAESGIDALSHALESYVTARANPLSDTLSLKGIEYIGRFLRQAYSQGAKSLEARYFMCLGVCMGTMAIRSSGLGVIHALCYPHAVKYHLSHGLSIALIMPSVMEYNMISNLPKFANIAMAMGMKTEGLSVHEAALKSIEAVRLLLRDVGLSRKLRDFGIPKEDLGKYAEDVVKYYPHLFAANPRDLSTDEVRQIYENAY